MQKMAAAFHMSLLMQKMAAAFHILDFLLYQ
jgi:hypothetical protein